MGKKALISKHIVLCSFSQYHASKPMYGIILIEGEIIYDVILVDENIPPHALAEKYSEWNPVNYEDFYISPGIIDLCVRREWDDCSALTKAAVSGGTCFLLEEPGYYIDQPPTGQLYCDVGKVGTIEVSNIENITSYAEEGCFAVRGYLFPPSLSVQCIPTNLEGIFKEIAKTGMVLLIDPTLPDPRMLYVASPLRLESIEKRRKPGSVSTLKIFAAAFPDAIESDEEDEEEEDKPDTELLQKPQSIMKRALSAEDNRPEVSIQERRPSEFMHIKEISISPTIDLPIPEISEVDEETSPQKLLKIKSRTIFDDLNARVKESYFNIENLSLAEQSTYQYSSSSQVESLSPVKKLRSESFSGILVNNIDDSDSSAPASELSSPKPQSLYERRLRGNRPPPLATKMEQNPVKECIYINHLANYPEHWELTGVEKIIQSLKKVACPVHITNLSSAAALNRVRQAKGSFSCLTCELSASKLSFTHSAIRDGDTRFKDSSPIRNKSNFILLWDLLKMKGIDSISSQHAFIKADYKALDSGNFQKALNGICALGFTLQAIWTMLNVPVSTTTQLDHYIVRMAKWLSLHPAKILNIHDSRGSIEKNKYADLIVWAPYERFKAKEENKDYEKVSPFVGMEMLGKIHYVYVRGKMAFDEGDFKARGKRVLRLDR